VGTAAGEGPDESHPYRQRGDEAVAALGTDAQRGLTDEKARSRLEKNGPNELTGEEPAPGPKVRCTLEGVGTGLNADGNATFAYTGDCMFRGR
jgi:hypothetical protein